MEKANILTLGMSIDNCIEKLVNQAREKYNNLYVDFNGIKITATPFSTVEELLENYNKESEKREREYLNSEAYKKAQLKEKETVQRMQNHIDKSVKKLEKMNNHKEIVSFVGKVQAFTDRVGVDSSLILETLKNKGYESGVNTDEDFNEKDSDNYARYIVGQAMANLETVGAIHPMVSVFANSWNRIFV